MGKDVMRETFAGAPLIGMAGVKLVVRPVPMGGGWFSPYEIIDDIAAVGRVESRLIGAGDSGWRPGARPRLSIIRIVWKVVI